jgi:tetratricopeptide (TPR) repeat protein
MRRYPAVLVVAACVGAAFLALARRPQADHRVIPASRTAYDPLRAAKTVAFYEATVKRDPQGAVSYGLLSGAYLKRANETGDLSDIRKAEAAARRSLAIRTKRNAVAYIKLSQSLIAQHRFAEALEAAQNAQGAGGSVMSQRLQADILFELGRYASAEALVRRQGVLDDPGGLAQRSRFLLLRGENEEAIQLLRRACRKVDHTLHIPAEDAAWIHTRLGVALAATGRGDEADHEYATALNLFPNDNKTLTLRADLAGHCRDWRRASEYAAEALRIERTPEALVILGECRRAMGDRVGAERLFQEVEAGITHVDNSGHKHDHQRAHSHNHGVLRHIHRRRAAHPVVKGGHGHTHDRHLILFCADHNRNLEEALALARHELTVRQDIYTQDALAWTLYKLGRFSEAEAASRNALAHGTKDARLLYHAGMISRALGHYERSRKYFADARQIDPLIAVPDAVPNTTRIRAPRAL